MLKTSTMKPFDKGDIFLGCSYLNDPEDDHKGEGRILQFDRNWMPKGTLYTEGTTYLIVGCTFAPDGTLWAFDSQGHIVVTVSPDGKQQENWDPGRGFGSTCWDDDGNQYFGEYFIGPEIWKGTSVVRKMPNGMLGDGNIYKYDRHRTLLETFDVDNAPEFTGFKGVTHMTIHPSKQFITYTTETSRRLMRFDIVNARQMEDLDGYPDADPADQSDKRWFIAPMYMPDGRLLCTATDGLRVYDEDRIVQTVPLPGYGWAQCCADADPNYALAANIWNGLAARVNLKTGKLEQTIDSGFTAPFRSLAGIAAFTG